ncbi:hypothetical protein BDW22DRAFT_1399456 [Trametopsis cervina]|nr:hypothetical protein BDW22DRAFT_1399456 [Trametopsis cervina]
MRMLKVEYLSWPQVCTLDEGTCRGLVVVLTDIVHRQSSDEADVAGCTHCAFFVRSLSHLPQRRRFLDPLAGILFCNNDPVSFRSLTM